MGKYIRCPLNSEYDNLFTKDSPIHTTPNGWRFVTGHPHLPDYWWLTYTPDTTCPDTARPYSKPDIIFPIEFYARSTDELDRLTAKLTSFIFIDSNRSLKLSATINATRNGKLIGKVAISPDTYLHGNFVIGHSTLIGCDVADSIIANAHVLFANIRNSKINNDKTKPATMNALKRDIANFLATSAERYMFKTLHFNDLCNGVSVLVRPIDIYEKLIIHDSLIQNHFIGDNLISRKCTGNPFVDFFDYFEYTQRWMSIYFPKSKTLTDKSFTRPFKPNLLKLIEPNHLGDDLNIYSATAHKIPPNNSSLIGVEVEFDFIASHTYDLSVYTKQDTLVRNFLSLWLDKPEVSVNDYKAFLSNIAHLKTDYSLNNGFEVAFRARPLGFMLPYLTKLHSVAQKLQEKGYTLRGGQRSAGTHFHFTRTPNITDKVVERIRHMIYQEDKAIFKRILAFSKREVESDYALFLPNTDHHANRNQAVNYCIKAKANSHDTIEFRLFAGGSHSTATYEAWIAFCQTAIELAINNPDIAKMSRREAFNLLCSALKRDYPHYLADADSPLHLLFQ